MRKKLKRARKRPFVPPPGYVTKEGAYRYVGVSRATWERWLALKIAPPVTRIGGRVLWRIAAIDAWLLRREEKGAA